MKRPASALVLLAIAELLGMSLWFSASAVSDEFRAMWSLSQSQAGWLTTVVQLGFVVGTATAAVLNLADLVPARRYFATAAAFGALANAALVITPDYRLALGLRFATGFFLAGVYPPGMKMAATWFRRGRGLAIGTVVGALTVGKAAPYLMRAWMPGGIVPVVLSVSAGAIFASVLVIATYRDGPYAFSRRPFSWDLVGSVLRQREMRLATGGYLGHMWELYAFWTWIPAFLAASVAAGGQAISETAVSFIAFFAIAVGGVGCLWGGWVADRIGYDRLVIRAMAVSGICALLTGLVFGSTLWLVVPLTLIWGFFVIADSAQFSALITEVVPAHAVGTALTIQTSLGFLLTMLTIQLVPALAEVGGWRWAFAILTFGPMVGIWSIARLAPRLRRGTANSDQAIDDSHTGPG
ncbi:MAG: MFS transporter [Gemmatimonadota bacterium]|nr:MFS transporter [Gemmatimonadota bacterium]MDH3369204.1 MFS transporter [Gemmatimonadota bacterium]MDH3477520.1 MFS transporter [Gemmatimonadota bacterium]MDH3568997.1 MFS transporter [Gemmatimonadota bacterium]MDH5549163.1 MFS transporter [Gemmatimonadota bacterium]